MVYGETRDLREERFRTGRVDSLATNNITQY